MTDHVDDAPEQDRVRGLLGDLAADDLSRPPPMPDDVRHRLEETLAGLREPGQQAEVVPLVRRWRPALATAAAVVLVAGGGFLVASGTGALEADDAGAESAGSTAPEEAQDDAPAPESFSAPAPSPSGSAGAEDRSDVGSAESTSPEPARVVVPTVTAADLDDDVARLVRRGVLETPDVASRTRQEREVRRAGCRNPVTSGSTQVVVYDGQPAVLVLDAAPAAAAIDDAPLPVTVVRCDTGAVLQQTQLAAGGADR